MIKIILQITYLYSLLPLLIGFAVASLAKRRINLSSVYVSGYVVYFALFEILTIWESRYASYNRLTRYWELTIYAITIIVIACTIYGIIGIYRRNNLFSLNISREAATTVVLTLVLVILAVLFFVPHALDDTPELARLSMAGDSFFSIDPSTGRAYADASACPGYLHLFYAFGSTVTGLDVTILIHVILPVFLIPLFVCAYLSVAETLFPSEETSRDRFRFVWLILLFYILMLPLEAHLAFTPFRNIWNGMTLAASCLLPLFVSVCIKLVRIFITDESIAAASLFNALIGLLCLTLSVRLCVSFGLIICVLFIMASVIMIAAHLLWHRRSTACADFSSEGGEHS